MIERITLTPVVYALIGLTVYSSWMYFKLSKDKQISMLFFPYYAYRGQNLFSSITSMFTHSSWEHLAFNMFGLYFLGPAVEYQVGGLVFVMLYFISGFSGDLALIHKYKNNKAYCSIGASGATSGVVFGFIALNPLESLQIILIPISFPAYIFGILYLIGSIVQAKRNSDQIAHEAHIGGAVGGALFMILYQVVR